RTGGAPAKPTLDLAERCGAHLDQAVTQSMIALPPLAEVVLLPQTAGLYDEVAHRGMLYDVGEGALHSTEIERPSHQHEQCGQGGYQHLTARGGVRSQQCPAESLDHPDHRVERIH